MADAYARVSGHLGVMFSSTGPGAANTVPGLVEANFAASPVLHITGQTPTKYIDRDMGTVHDVPGQTAMLAAVGKAAFRIRSAQEALGVLTRAAALALTPPMGPVSVEVPIDIQRTPIPRPAQLDTLVLPIPPPLPPTEAALDEAAEILLRAKRPMLWLGNGAKAAGAEAMALMDLGFGAVSSWNGRGIVPEDHPMTLGGLHGNGSPRVQEFYRTVDAMLIVGSRLRGHETGDFSLALPDTRIHVDVDPATVGANYPVDAGIVGDAKLVLAQLLAALIEAGARASDGHTSAAAGRVARARREKYEVFDALARADDMPIRPERIVAELNALLPSDSIVVADPGTPCPYFSAYYRVAEAGRHYWSNRAHGALGYSMAAAIGAAIGRPSAKVVSVMGDGSFGMTCGELETIVRLRLPMTMIVVSNSTYGWIKAGQKSGFDARYFSVDFSRTDHAKVASAFGVKSFTVSDPAKLQGTLRQALEAGEPTLVDVIAQPLHEANAPVSEWIA
jgi:acetolactate synthase-1/2/3 large subunit